MIADKLSILILALFCSASFAQNFLGYSQFGDLFPVTPCSCQKNDLTITNIQVFPEKSSIFRPKYQINVTATLQESSHLIQYSFDLFKEDTHFSSSIWDFDSQVLQGQVIKVSFEVEFTSILPRGNYKLLTTFYDVDGLSVGCGQIELTKQ